MKIIPKIIILLLLLVAAQVNFGHSAPYIADANLTDTVDVSVETGGWGDGGEDGDNAYGEPDNDSSNSILGDVNGDGEVNVADLSIIQNFILGIDTTNEKTDVNGDGYVDVADLSVVQSIILGL